MFNFKELLYLVIISFNLVTLMCDSGAILSGEIRCWSILGFKGSEVIAVGNNAKKNCLQYLGYLFIYLFIYLYDRHFKFWIDTHVFKSYFDFSKDDKCLGGD